MNNFSKPTVLLFLSFILALPIAQAQDRTPTFQGLIERAIEKMDNGEIEAALEDLDKAREMKPNSYIVYYEMGYAYMLDEDYPNAAKYFELATQQERTTGQCWQMLGNVYDYMEQPEKAIETYDKGLELFPEFGGLYVERGVMAGMAEQYAEALSYWEKGIEAAPRYPGNYYQLGKVFAGSNTPIWALFYGELFRHMEPKSSRSENSGANVYRVYRDHISVIGKRRKKRQAQISLAYSPEADFPTDDVISEGEARTDFVRAVEATAAQAAVEVFSEKDTLTLAKLAEFRALFTQLWFESEASEQHPNLIFSLWKRATQAGHMEAYTYWVCRSGSPDDYEAWVDTHDEEWDAFATWFSKYKIRPKEGRTFLRPAQE